MVKIVDHDERRRLIANAAVSVIAEKGLEQAKLRVIAEKAGVTTGTIAHYFKNKEEVLEAALYEVGARLFTLKTKDGNKQLLKFVEILPTNEVNQKYWRTWLAFCGHVGYSENLRKIYTEFYHGIEKAVVRNLNIKEKNKAREVAACIIAAVDGVGLCATVQPDLWSPERQKSRLKTLLRPFFKN